MNNINKEALKLHLDNKGKITVNSKIKVSNKEELSLAYSPGVAAPCIEIKDNPENVYKYTSKNNLVAVVSDGSAVLGLGDIGAYASLPVMEGKAILFKEFANVDAFPICLNTNDVDEIVNTVKLISPTFGGINLEDISAPRCFEIEERLKSELNIPVFHDDQHGTAIVTLAGLINSCKLTNRNIEESSVIVSGTGAAGISIIKLLNRVGVKKIYAYNKNGVISSNTKALNNQFEQQLLDNSIILDTSLTFKELFVGTDVFIGVSAANIVSKEMIESMADKPIVFAMANPNPEIDYNLAKEAGAFIVGTGRSDYPNQVNNVLAFPGIFRGALDGRKTKITEQMKLNAAYAIANIIDESKLNPEYIIPDPFDKSVASVVAKAVIETD